MDTAILPSQFNWHFLTGDTPTSQALAKELELPSLLTQILHNRGYSSASDYKKLLASSLRDLPDPRQMPDYQEAEDAVFRARAGPVLQYQQRSKYKNRPFTEVKGRVVCSNQRNEDAKSRISGGTQPRLPTLARDDAKGLRHRDFLNPVNY